jgi:hypothetical protein
MAVVLYGAQHREADAVWCDNVSTQGYPQPCGRNAQCGDYDKGFGGILSRKIERDMWVELAKFKIIFLQTR